MTELGNKEKVEALLSAEALLPMLMGWEKLEADKLPESVTLSRDDLVELRKQITHVDDGFEGAAQRVGMWERDKDPKSQLLGWGYSPSYAETILARLPFGWSELRVVESAEGDPKLLCSDVGGSDFWLE
jgi:hypothetical protein